MSRYFYLLCDETKCGLRLGQGGDHMGPLYKAAIPLIGPFLDAHHGKSLVFITDYERDDVYGDDWNIVGEGERDPLNRISAMGKARAAASTTKGNEQ